MVCCGPSPQADHIHIFSNSIKDFRVLFSLEVFSLGFLEIHENF